MQIVSLILATICVITYIYGILKSKPYEYLIENLNGEEYPLKELYPIGYAISNIPFLRLRGSVRDKLIKYAKLLYMDIYKEYYAELAWAQFLSFTLFFSCFILIFSSLLGRETVLLFWIVLVLCAAVFWNMFISKMKETVEKRSEICELEFPDMISKLSLLIGSGMVLRDAWNVVAFGKKGELYKLMQMACQDMANGMSDIDAIYHFGVLSDSRDIKKFTGVIIQEIEKGSGELGSVLLYQSKELWLRKRQLLLQKGEKAAGKLIIPVGITFGGIILVIMVAAVSGLSL